MWRRALSSSAAVMPALARWWTRHLVGLRPRTSGSDVAPFLAPAPRRSLAEADWSEVLATGRPVVLTGVVERWPLFRRCTRDDLVEALGREWISALVASASSRDFGRAWLAGSRVRMPAATFLDEVLAKEPGDVRYYAWSVGLAPFVSQFDRPDSIGGRRYLPSASSLWIGQGGNLTSLHYDHWHGFLGQLVGRKRLVLFAPGEARRLYARSPFSPLAASTRLPADCLRASPADFPLFRGARGCEVTLEPGDLLYVPPYWWHQAECVDAAVSLTLRYDLTRRERARAGSLPRRVVRARKDFAALREHLRGRSARSRSRAVSERVPERVHG